MFKNPFSFDGRIRRTEYGLTFIILAVGRVTLGMFLASVSSGLNGISGQDITVIDIVLQIPLLWFFWAQGSKRCHDIGWSGWMQLIPFIPVYLIFASGHIGMNKYGVDPKEKAQNF